jgi:hypothetical protein
MRTVVRCAAGWVPTRPPITATLTHSHGTPLQCFAWPIAFSRCGALQDKVAGYHLLRPLDPKAHPGVRNFNKDEEGCVTMHVDVSRARCRGMPAACHASECSLTTRCRPTPPPQAVRVAVQGQRHLGQAEAGADHRSRHRRLLLPAVADVRSRRCLVHLRDAAARAAGRHRHPAPRLRVRPGSFPPRAAPLFRMHHIAGFWCGR